TDQPDWVELSQAPVREPEQFKRTLDRESREHSEVPASRLSKVNGEGGRRADEDGDQIEGQAERGQLSGVAAHHGVPVEGGPHDERDSDDANDPQRRPSELPRGYHAPGEGEDGEHEEGRQSVGDEPTLRQHGTEE